LEKGDTDGIIFDLIAIDRIVRRGVKANSVETTVQNSVSKMVLFEPLYNPMPHLLSVIVFSEIVWSELYIAIEESEFECDDIFGG